MHAGRIPECSPRFRTPDASRSKSWLGGGTGVPPDCRDGVPTYTFPRPARGWRYGALPDCRDGVPTYTVPPRLRAHLRFHCASGRAGFTLIELILVVAIIVLAMTIALPTVGRSLKSARLKAAAREAVVLSRYARNASILHNRHHVMLFSPEERKIELLELARTGFQGAATDPMASLDSARQVEERLREAEVGETHTVASTGLRTRRLPEGIGIEDFTCSAEEQEHQGVFWVNYYPNGMCDAHAFAIADARGRRFDITVDGITGEIRLRQNW